MKDVELKYLAAAIHVVVPAHADGPSSVAFADPKRVRDALAEMTSQQRALVGEVLDGMLRERADGSQAPPTDANRL